MKLAPAALGASLALAGCATGPAPNDHAAHHPSAAATAAPGRPTPVQMDSMMKSMQQMHDKLMAAKTPEERSALMKDHMKAMQDGMAMMGQMRGGMMSGAGMGMGGGKGTGSGMPMDAELMKRRMDMMEMMMQMMMDRQGMTPPTAK